jgi:hypothetical protein
LRLRLRLFLRLLFLDFLRLPPIRGEGVDGDEGSGTGTTLTTLFLLELTGIEGGGGGAALTLGGAALTLGATAGFVEVGPLANQLPILL